MDVKSSTKTWRDGASNYNEDMIKNDRPLTDAQKEKIGAEDLGALLNKVTDPNYVDNSKKIKSVGNDKMDKDAFFKLMLAQLKNQDPTNPLKNHEMAAQLAQFSTLEQMTNVNTTLTEMKGAQKPVEQFQALNLIGKVVSGDSAKINHTQITKSHEFKFELSKDAAEAEVEVRNSKNELIKKYSFTNLKQGENKMSWNGENDRGVAVKPGDYKFVVNAKSSTGETLKPKTDFSGQVTGITFSQEGPVLQVGQQSIKLKDVKQFSDPGLMSNDQNSKSVENLDLKKQEQEVKNNIKEETKSEQQLQAESQSSDEMFAQLGLNQSLIDKVKQAQSKTDEKAEL